MLFKNNATIMRQHRLGTSLIKNVLTILELYCALFLRISHLGLDQTLNFKINLVILIETFDINV